jgi:ribulose-bisphosphate carboxylase large chain
VAVPGETEALKQRFAARVERIEPLESVSSPSLPTGRAPAARYHRACVTVSWSTENFGRNLPTLVSTLQGNLYELAQFSGLRLLDFTVPASFASAFRGPAFGIAGTRRLTGVEGRPPHRHHHQAQHRPPAGADGGHGPGARRGRH